METKNKSLSDISSGDVGLDEFREMVAVNAYYRAEKRAFEDGYELDDWLEAEQEISNQRRYWVR